MNTPENLVFVADRHGRADLQRAVINQYGSDAQYVFIGDHVDGSSEEQELLRELRDMYDPNNPCATMGNHEFDRIQVVKASLQYKAGIYDTEMAVDCHDVISRWVQHRSMGRVALPAYGIEQYYYKDPVDAIMKLYERMQEDNLFDFLVSLPLFYEDEQHIAIHAGLTDSSWEQQKATLESARHELLHGVETGMDPEQLFSFRLAMQRHAFSATDKIVITGHAPTRETANQRVTAQGKRVRLDSVVKNPSVDTIYTYHAGAKEVKAVRLNDAKTRKLVAHST